MNCSFEILDSLAAFKDLFYLLMIGSGVGIRILRKDVEKIPKIRTDYELIHEDYTPTPKREREDNTSIEFHYNSTVKITVGDSKEGWVQSLEYFLNLLCSIPCTIIPATAIKIINNQAPFITILFYLF